MIIKSYDCRNLREMFKIDAADYMMSICGCAALRELSSPGKSGSIFFLSQDDRFMIKTLRKSEVKVFIYAQEDEIAKYPQGLVLIPRASEEESVVVGPHIRGSRLRASAAGFEEVDLLLPGTAR
ncbi:hypothetical protein GW17_00042220 [Ensete ventricosum]|nr:hypothetical protein GW17_00042220 [Ensete ventricosum]